MESQFLPQLLPLAGTHAGLDDVDHVVAQLLALVDEVHVDGAHGCGLR